MLKRKIYEKLIEWKEKTNGKTALMIEGARRVGKSYIVEEFAKAFYKNYVIIDFSIMSDKFKNLFNSLENIEEFYRDLFLSLRKKPLETGDLIVFDEIQFCPKARQLIKHLVCDGRYHFIETGSLVSIKENTSDILIPSEEERISMYPMDFEEFMWAIEKDYIVDDLKKMYLSSNYSGSQRMHQMYMKDFKLYLAIGGMPQAVKTYVETMDFYAVQRVKNGIIKLYEEDLKKIDNKFGTICSLVYKQIPVMLNRETRRFIVSSVDERADSVVFRNTLEKLEESKMVNIVYKANEPSLGFVLNKDESAFKIYYNDIGLFVSHIYMDESFDSTDIYQKLIFGEMSSNLGMLYENYASQSFVSKGYEPYFFQWNDKEENKTYEIDFIFHYKKHITPFEIKSGRIRSLASLKKLKEKCKGFYENDFVISNRPFEKKENTIFIPMYLLFAM